LETLVSAVCVGKAHSNHRRSATSPCTSRIQVQKDCRKWWLFKVFFQSNKICLLAVVTHTVHIDTFIQFHIIPIMILCFRENKRKATKIAEYLPQTKRIKRRMHISNKLHCWWF